MFVFQKPTFALQVVLLLAGTKMFILANNVDPSCVTWCKSNTPPPGNDDCPDIFDPVLCDIDGCREVYSSECDVGDRFQGRNITCKRVADLVDKDINTWWDMVIWPECLRLSDSAVGFEDCQTYGSYRCPVSNDNTNNIVEESSSIENDASSTSLPNTEPHSEHPTPITWNFSETDVGTTSRETGTLIMIILVAVAAVVVAICSLLEVSAYNMKLRKKNQSVSISDDTIVEVPPNKEANEVV